MLLISNVTLATLATTLMHFKFNVIENVSFTAFSGLFDYTHQHTHNCLFATLQIPVICGTIGATDQSVNKYARRNATCMCGACSATTILNAPALLLEILIRLFAYYLVFLFKIQLRLILLHFSYSFLQNNMTMHILSR